MHIDLLFQYFLLNKNFIIIIYKLIYIKHFIKNFEYILIELINKVLIEMNNLYLIHKFLFH
jgi:hypothetical protein